MGTWPHAPSKVVTAPGTIIITGGTHYKQRLFHDETRLRLLHDLLLETVEAEGWTPLAWAVFRNHYHIVGISQPKENPMRSFAARLHTLSATALNRLDNEPKRKVWYRSWDTRLTYEKSIMARLAYVHHNAVKHAVVQSPEDYEFCSARWFLAKGDKPFVESVLSFKTDTVNVYDDFD